VLVTGAGGGIGSVLAGELATAGCHLCISDIDEAGLAKTQAACVQRGGGAARVIMVVADLRRREDIERLSRECIAAFGHVDILINNGAPAPQMRTQHAPAC
jgi:NAD(P)-dependent dehydrogenase (short-subunit alcohol dehydrogenase family)